jgi:hypothetical protein
MQILLVELTNDMDDGFWLCCVGGGGEGAFVFSVGCSWGRQLELHWAEFFEDRGFNFPASYCFCRICILLKVSVWFQFFFQTSKIYA